MIDVTCLMTEPSRGRLQAPSSH